MAIMEARKKNRIRSRILVTSSEVEKSSWAIWNDFYKKQFTLVLRKNTCNFRKTWKLSPATTKTVNDKDVPFQELVLKDKSTKLTLAVWEEMVDSFEVGQKAKFSKCRVRLFNEEKKLSTTTSSASEVYTEEDDLDEVSSEDETMSDSPGSTQLPTGTLIAVFEVDPYLACPKVSCNNTKLETLKEPDIELKKITVFSPQIKKLLESRGLDSAIHFDRKEMLTKLLQIIPIDIHYTLVNNTVRNLTCKRIQDV
ncbi:hypothetical protein KUTeg_014495 [Tegillarca granosa]|uniref:Uncharacterized protein n=1 Tax=Tegillarca granosa TaxID=220873 RepID=A0ABQ9ERW3_TEGGR|nr:hypothetical protein KUTeg_014495 [Tegillarca granosa]